jgi:hypothetical protein
MDIDRLLLIGLLGPIVTGAVLALLVGRQVPSRGAMPWSTLLVALLYPAGAYALLGQTVWPMIDSLDRLIIVVPGILIGASFIDSISHQWKRYRFPIVLLVPVLIAGTWYLTDRRRNSIDLPEYTATLAWQIGAVVLSAFVVTLSRPSHLVLHPPGEPIARTHGDWVPLALLAGTSLGLAGLLKVTGVVSLGDMVIPLAGLLIGMTIMMGVRGWRFASPMMPGATVMALGAFIIGGWTWSKLPVWAGLVMLAVPMWMWVERLPVVARQSGWLRGTICLVPAAIVVGVVVGRFASAFIAEMNAEPELPY